MLLLDELRSEHDRIECVAGALLTYANLASPAESDALLFVAFFRSYAAGWHHEREEAVLFPTLLKELALRPDDGPIATLLDDHHRTAAMLRQIEDAARAGFGETGVDTLRGLCRGYAEALLHHIDAENSVLFPEAELRLRRAGIAELPQREADPALASAITLGDDLIVRYPPSVDPDIVRGEGCMMCPGYGDTCRGIEREWWNEWEWEEMDEHVAAS